MRLLTLFESLGGYYGWINRKGQFLPGDHGTIIKQHYRDRIIQDFDAHTEEAFDNIDEGETYGYGFRDGWIRVSSSQRETAFEVGRYTTARAFKGMLKLIREVDRQDGGLIGIQFDSHYDAFPSGRQALVWLNRMQRRIVKESTLTEKYEIPGTYYGYWITHTGEYLPVDDEAHHWTALDWFEQNPHEGNVRELGVFETAYKKGWIRIIDNGDPDEHVHVSILNPADVSPVAARAILPWIRQVDDRRDVHTIIFDLGRGHPLPRWGSYPTKKELYKYFWDLSKVNRQKVVEAEIPETEYGYWITHHGEFLDVPFENHAMVAHRYFQKHPEEMKAGISGYERAFELGWVRIIDSNGVNIRVRNPKECRAEALRSLLGYLGQVHKDNRVFVDLGYQSPPLQSKTPHIPTKQEITKYFMRFLIGKRRPQMVAEGEIPPTRYGYWITDQGEFIPVRAQFHQMVSDQYFPEGDGLNRIVRAYKAGWVRVVMEPRYLDFDLLPKSVRKRALQRMLLLMRETEKDTWPEPLKVMFDLLGTPRPRNRFDDISKANAFVRSLMTRQMAVEARV